jgi:hypothetical protein
VTAMFPRMKQKHVLLFFFYKDWALFGLRPPTFRSWETILFMIITPHQPLTWWGQGYLSPSCTLLKKFSACVPLIASKLKAALVERKSRRHKILNCSVNGSKLTRPRATHFYPEEIDRCFPEYDLCFSLVTTTWESSGIEAQLHLNCYF